MPMKKQGINPFLPSYEYVPDGEPHVFGDRIYLYGSHDRYLGANFCLNDYVCYSAHVDALGEWRYEGIIYKKEQDPRNQNIAWDAPKPQAGAAALEGWEDNLNPPGIHAMYAPDVVEGIDGRYYLYYCLDDLPEIAVAVCDTPAGVYEFYGYVQHREGTPLGKRAGDYFQFDPGLFIDDDRTIYLYSGNAPLRKEDQEDHRTSQVMKLEQDMLTLVEEPKKLMCDVRNSQGTSFEGHEFFEASSVRKINGSYYFIYSSVNMHELCYAISHRPDGDFIYGGTIVDIGDIYLQGRTAELAVNYLGNTHGGMECIKGHWFIFYHRHSSRTQYSRQACAERIVIQEDGRITQVEATSCGLNQGPLLGKGSYPAYICCHLTGKNGVKFSLPQFLDSWDPYLTQDGSDIEAQCVQDYKIHLPIQYISNITDGTTIGYKYFDFQGLSKIKLSLRGRFTGKITYAVDLQGEGIKVADLDLDTMEWLDVEHEVVIPDGVYPMYMKFEGAGKLELKELVFKDRT